MATAVEDPTMTDAPQGDTQRRSDSVENRPDTLKRRASPSPSNDAKRARRDSQEQRKQPSVQDEKKRNKRLFGGLLSTLSQGSSSNPAQKKRLEIERRQQERMQKQKEDDQRERRAKAESRREQREKDGIVWDEEVMRNRHSRMLKSARFLKTRARPPVYYLPAKRSAKQDDAIDEQIEHTRRHMRREEDEFEERRRRHEETHGRRKSLDRPRMETHLESKEVLPDTVPAAPAVADTPSAAGTEERTLQTEQEDTTKEAHARPRHPQATGETQGDHDESGDEIVDAEEDMVIY